MATAITPETLQALLSGSAPFALIDVREAGEYNSSHIAGASSIPRRQIEASERGIGLITARDAVCLILERTERALGVAFRVAPRHTRAVDEARGPKGSRAGDGREMRDAA